VFGTAVSVCWAACADCTTAANHTAVAGLGNNTYCCESLLGEINVTVDAQTGSGCVAAPVEVTLW
jgi:hypothetical protein